MATTTSIAIFKARYPQIVLAFTLSDDRIGVFLDEAAIEVSECAYGAYYQKAVLLHTAHFLVIESAADAEASDPASAAAAFTSAGGVASASVGDTSVSRNLYAPTDSDEGTFSATIYGQEFLRIRKKMGRGTLVAKEREPDEKCANKTPPGILF